MVPLLEELLELWNGFHVGMWQDPLGNVGSQCMFCGVSMIC